MIRKTLKVPLYGRFFSPLLLALLLAGILGGCASQATYQGMTPEAVPVAAKHAKTVSISVSGGQETSAIGKPQISDAEFARALSDAVEKSQVFSRVLRGKQGDYRLTVVLSNPEQPVIGFSMTVKMEAGWTLVRAGDGVTVWQEVIRSEYTAGVGEAFAAVKRLRVATEGAAKRNIAEGLSRLSKLNL